MLDKMKEVDVVDKLTDMAQDLVLKDEAISVSQLNKLAKLLLENNMPVFWIRGEISGLRTYSHVYLDLKDEGAKVSCVVFAKILSTIDFTLANGQQIEVRGKVSIYAANGSYQINVERIRKVGMGELWEAYHRLMNKLKSEGLFNAEHKQEIPIFPKTIGVITSKEGSVIRDVITTLKRRMPNIPIVIYHTAVQGTDAGMQITRAIRSANLRAEVDVLIVCRGGGSMEDLWSFNEEIVAREVYASKIPIISAVGHETDTTIIDFVADLRAPTPTAAAELVARSRDEWDSLVHKLHYQLDNNFMSIINYKRQLVDLYLAQLKAKNPLNQLKEKIHKVLVYENRLQSSIRSLVRDKSHQLEVARRLSSDFSRIFKSKSRQLDALISHLALVNPKNILARGYAIVKNKQGKILQSSTQVKQHERIEIILAQDTLSAIVDKNHNARQEELI